MPLDPSQLAALKDYLKDDGVFRQHMEALREQPFRPLDTGQLSTREEAIRSEPRKIMATVAVLVALVLAVTGVILCRPPIRKSIYEILPVRVPLWVIPTASWIPLCVVCFVLAAVLAAVAVMLIRVKRLHAWIHLPDMLFAQIMQEAASSARPLPSAVIYDLLTHKGFQPIFDRAIDITFPHENGRDHVLDPRVDLDRLVGALVKDESFVKFFNGYGSFFSVSDQTKLTTEEAAKLKELYEAGFQWGWLNSVEVGLPKKRLAAYIEDSVRTVLFETILEDPACAFIYSDSFNLWHSIIAWLKNLDLKQAKELWPAAGESKKHESKPSEVKTVAYIVLAVAVVTAIAKNEGAKATPQTDPKTLSVDLTPEAKSELSQLSKVASDLVVKIEGLMEAQKNSPGGTTTLCCPNPGSSGTVVNNYPTGTSSGEKPVLTNVNLPAIVTSINLPGINPNINLPPTAISGTLSAIVPPAAGPRIEVVTPSSQTRAVMGGDDSVSLSWPPGKETVPHFALTSSAGTVCDYSVELQPTDQPKRWPPNPLTVRLRNIEPTGPDCAQLSLNGTKFELQKQPVYSELLKAYMSTNEHWKWSKSHPFFTSTQ